MSKPTPGPWKIIALEPKGYGDPNYVTNEIECADGRIVASVVHDSFDEYAANANLIAAAPDLLEALESALSTMESDEVKIDGEWGNCRTLKQIEKDGDLSESIIAARAAIAKAKGVKS